MAQAEGYELSDDELDHISGGLWDDEVGYRVHCTFCGWTAELPEKEYRSWDNICRGCGALLMGQ